MSYSWTRSFAYYFGNYDDYKSDEPREKEISLKACLMKQILLSKLRLKKTPEQKEEIPYDLKKIKSSKIKINMDDYKMVKDYEIIPPMPKLIRHRAMTQELSQKQQSQQTSYADRLHMLRNSI